ncbi:glycosyltransferase family 4 protein [Aequorivita echinoideorum]|uniref:Glycosyltransferase family 4 protein n=1 Tax=Aequorivita echinoideorum TaxID=1549647 RepID=A0ABS5S5G7_9FLAO|nr:glycosyltransferase family 4 protein [Aequorivita echinoideorum]MBT0608464.1 glycosyltransferase family 4 protein [Aequorivita echinoideorum]
MKILQLIDSLEGGGAERMAVNLANALAKAGQHSYLCATRGEGILKSGINTEVGYLFLNKKNALDFYALSRLRKLVKQHKIEIVHAHGTSFFFATLLKICYPKIRLVWHDHNGNRVNQQLKNNKSLFVCSYFFNQILAVNQELENWSAKHLFCKSVKYVPNFVSTEISDISIKEKVILCLANLRNPKNHLNLLKAFKIVNSAYKDWQLHLVGRDYNDLYSREIKEFISDNNLNKTVKIFGSSNTVNNHLKIASIGVLASESEGLPMSLLEYGIGKLAVVATNVGQCATVIQEYGKVVPSNNPEALASALLDYIENEKLRNKHARQYHEHILKIYSEKAIVPKLLEIYQNL